MDTIGTDIPRFEIKRSAVLECLQGAITYAEDERGGFASEHTPALLGTLENDTLLFGKDGYQNIRCPALAAYARDRWPMPWLAFAFKFDDLVREKVNTDERMGILDVID